MEQVLAVENQHELWSPQEVIGSIMVEENVDYIEGENPGIEDHKREDEERLGEGKWKSWKMPWEKKRCPFWYHEKLVTSYCIH